MSDNEIEILEEDSYQAVPINSDFYQKHKNLFTKQNLQAIDRIFNRCNVDNFKRLEDSIGKTNSELDQATQWYNYEAGCHKEYKASYEKMRATSEKLTAENLEISESFSSLEKLLEKTREAYGECSKALFSKNNEKQGVEVELNGEIKQYDKKCWRTQTKPQNDPDAKYNDLSSENTALKSVNTQLKQRIAKLEVQLAQNKQYKHNYKH